MEVKQKINDIIQTLNELDEYSSTLNDKLSEVDSKTQDLLHYVETNTLNVVWCYRFMKELKTIREKRREIKNDMELINKFNEHKTKLISNIDNRNMLFNEVCKREKQLNIPYKNRQYEENELKEILKK